jgi:hypothetical protein
MNRRGEESMGRGEGSQEQWMDGAHLGPPCPLEPGTVQYTAVVGLAKQAMTQQLGSTLPPCCARVATPDPTSCCPVAVLVVVTRLPGRRWMSSGNLEGRTAQQQHRQQAAGSRQQQPLLVLILEQSRSEVNLLRPVVAANQTKVTTAL